MSVSAVELEWTKVNNSLSAAIVVWKSKFDDRFARQNRYELSPEFPLASPYSGWERSSHGLDLVRFQLCQCQLWNWNGLRWTTPCLQQLLSHEPDVCALCVPWHLAELSRGTCIRGQEDCPRGCKNMRQKRGRAANALAALHFWVSQRWPCWTTPVTTQVYIWASVISW